MTAADTALPRLPIPVWVITGPLGSGKTTIISRLLAQKPPAENWVVLLNEFTEAGVDTLTVAASAQGAYDVRLVAGGCLCCVGEADFRRNLRDLIERIHPARILVEPSGIGHPGGIVDELLAHEARGELRLEAVIGLVDPERLDLLVNADVPIASLEPSLGETRENLRAAAELADAWVLTQDDRASDLDRQRFEAHARELFPRKAWIGRSAHGALPPSLWRALATAPRTRATHAHERHEHERHAHEWHEHQHATEREVIAPVQSVGTGERIDVKLLGWTGASWRFPRGAMFSETRLLAALSARPIGGDAALAFPERLKAVLQISADEWVLLQGVDGRLSLQASAWRRDQRIEVQVAPGRSFDAQAWDRLWLRCQKQDPAISHE